MKWSKYNHLFKSNSHGYLLYNSLSNSFVELDDEAYEYMLNLSRKKEAILIEDEDLYNNLIEIKALVDNDIDEFYNIKYNAISNRFNNNFLGLTINPTLHCNFACDYCFEENRLPIYMTEEVEDSIIEYIKSKTNVKGINITWFGGEPLMGFSNIVNITNKIQKLNIPFKSSMITNGYLLTETVINQLEKLNITRLQITIDGLAEKHDSRRKLVSGKGTFNQIINNIDNLKKRNPKFLVIIRVNIDETNNDEFIEVYKFFKQRYEHIEVTPAFVQDLTGCNVSDCLFDNQRKVKFLIEQYKKHNLNHLGFFPRQLRYECPIKNPNHITIGPKGEIYKCWNDVGNKDKVVANLYKKIPINTKILTRYYVAGDPFDDQKCKECFHLPTCGGGCPYQRLENEFNGKNFNTCDLIRDNLDEFLDIHYEWKINKTEAENN